MFPKYSKALGIKYPNTSRKRHLGELNSYTNRAHKDMSKREKARKMVCIFSLTFTLNTLISRAWKFPLKNIKVIDQGMTYVNESKKTLHLCVLSDIS